MKYKKFLSATALVTLLSLSNSAFSDPIDAMEDEETSYYVSGHYNADLFNMMSGQELKFGTSSLLSLKKDGTAVESNYKPNYGKSFIGGGVAAGYTMEGIRVELEGLYSKLDVDNTGYTTSGDEKVFGTVMAAKATVKDEVRGTNEGFTHIAAMINAYYDVDLGMEDIPVSPYIGIGAGLSMTNFIGASHYKPAYQAKAGVSYAVTPEIKLYAGYRYFGVYGSEFKDVELVKTADGTDRAKDTKEKLTLTQDGVLGQHGVEAGLTFHF